MKSLFVTKLSLTRVLTITDDKVLGRKRSMLLADGYILFPHSFSTVGEKEIAIYSGLIYPTLLPPE